MKHVMEVGDGVFDLKLDMMSAKEGLQFMGEAAEALAWIEDNGFSYAIVAEGRIDYMRVKFIEDAHAVAFKLRWL